MSRINGLQVSCPTDMSPTALFLACSTASHATDVQHGWGEVYPGYGRTGVGREGYTGYYPPAIPGSILSIF